MRLNPSRVKALDLTCEVELLTEDEKEVADYIAECLRNDRDGGGNPFILPIEEPVGLFIWRVCQQRGVNHHKIARHLGRRRKK